MEITGVRVHPVQQDKLRAFVSVVLDGCFVISDIKVIQGTNGLFVSMPSKRRKDGTFRDIVHPLNRETRAMFETAILAEYQGLVAGEKADGDRVPLHPAGVDPDGHADRDRTWP